MLCVKTWEHLLVMAFKSFQYSQHFSSLLNLLGIGKSIFSFNCWLSLTINYVESIKTEGAFFILVSFLHGKNDKALAELSQCLLWCFHTGIDKVKCLIIGLIYRVFENLWCPLQPKGITVEFKK